LQSWALGITFVHPENGRFAVYGHSSPEEFVVTWDVVRHWEPNSGYKPLGRNFFQVRLTRDGAIEIRYGDVAERDGIVGVISGQAPLLPSPPVGHRRGGSVVSAIPAKPAVRRTGVLTNDIWLRAEMGPQQKFLDSS
jgi:hypothetical protein